MAEVRKIVILGAAFGGLGTFHYLAKHVVPQLKGAKYEIHLVSESSSFWWNVAAPRQIVTMADLTVEKTFVPITKIIDQYPNLKDSIFFHHASATSLDHEARTVTLSPQGGETKVIDYYALVIATGVKSPTPLTTLHGDYTITEKALLDMNAKIGSAKEVVISGGGPIGVETAGEIGYHLKGKAKITLITGGDKLLPVFNKSRAAKAQDKLEKLGVTVVYGTKVNSAEQGADGKTQLSLDDGKTMTADIYIPAHGVKPNSEFVPASLKSSNGYINTNKETMRVDAAGPRVYAAGDIAGVDTGGIVNMYNSLPVLQKNLANDLLSEATGGSNSTDKKYTFTPAETQFVPVGPKTGVAAFNGWSVPGFVVSFVKGKDYMVGMGMADWTEGKKFAKAL